MNQITLQRRDNQHIVLSGDLTFDTVLAAQRQARLLFTSATKQLVIDLHAIARSDSAGLALLLDWLRLAKHHQMNLQLMNVPAQLLAMAKVCGLDGILPLMENSNK
ncbi:MAG: hypothetical protein Tsb005_06430 [Gammaproteobacteria bacterium]